MKRIPQTPNPGNTGLLSAYAVFLLLVVLVTPAQAYLDPGTGSMILQMVLGGVAGLAVLVKMYWQKLRELPGSLSANSRKDKAGDSESPEGQDPA